MSRKKPFLVGFWIMIFIIVVRVGFLIYTYILFRQIAARYNTRIPSQRLSLIPYVMIMILVAEAMFYWYRRYRIRQKIWAHIHIWTVFVAMIVIPLGVYIAYAVMSEIESTRRFALLANKISRIQFYAFLGLVTIGHIAFIVTIVKSFSPPKEIALNDEPSGILDEFVD